MMVYGSKILPNPIIHKFGPQASCFWKTPSLWGLSAWKTESDSLQKQTVADDCNPRTMAGGMIWSLVLLFFDMYMFHFCIETCSGILTVGIRAYMSSTLLDVYVLPFCHKFYNTPIILNFDFWIFLAIMRLENDLGFLF